MSIWQEARRPPLPLFAIPLAAGVTLAILTGGGFSSGSRAELILLAALAAAIAVSTETGLLTQAMRKPLVLALIGLGVLALVSGAWTIGRPAVSVRSGLVILAYAATVVCAYAITARTGMAPIAIGIVALAGIEAMIGLVAVAFHALPDAERIGTTWRPGGTLEYPPALALLQVFALAPLVTWLSGPRHQAVAAAVGAALAGAVLGSAGSRLELVLAAAVLGIGIIRPPQGAPGLATRVAGAPKGVPGRFEVVAAAVLVAAAAAVARVAFEQHAATSSDSAEIGRLLATLAACGALAAAWLPIRGRARSIRPRSSITPGLAAVVLLLALTVGAVLTTSGSGPDAQRRGGLAHGRVHEWNAAAQTWFDRPLFGAGAGAYYQASLTHQGRGATLFAHDLPLELAAELGVLGLALGLAIYGAGGYALWSARSSPALWLFGPAVAGFLVANLVDWPWHLAGLGAVWACAAGALLGRGRTGDLEAGGRVATGQGTRAMGERERRWKRAA